MTGVDFLEWNKKIKEHGGLAAIGALVAGLVAGVSVCNWLQSGRVVTLQERLTQAQERIAQQNEAHDRSKKAYEANIGDLQARIFDISKQSEAKDLVIMRLSSSAEKINKCSFIENQINEFQKTPTMVVVQYGNKEWDEEQERKRIIRQNRLSELQSSLTECLRAK